MQLPNGQTEPPCVILANVVAQLISVCSIIFAEMFCAMVSMFEDVLSWFLFTSPEGRGFRYRGAGGKKLKDTCAHNQSCLDLERAML